MAIHLVNKDDARHFVGLCGILPAPVSRLSLKQLERRVKRIRNVSEDEAESDEEGPC